MRRSVPSGRASRLAALTAACAVTALATAAPALAHDELIGSTPSAGAALTALPARVVLRFEEPPDPQGIRMKVVGPDGRRVNASAPRLSGSTISERIRSSKRRGTYAITFRIISDDGHPVSGLIRFTVAAGAPAVAAAAPAPAPPATADGSDPANTWIAGGAALLVLGAGAAAAMSLRRRRALIAPLEPVLSVQPEPERVPS